MAIANVLCNKTSIVSIYSSNHTPQEFFHRENDLPKDLISCLRLNQNNNKNEVVQQKCVLDHLFNGDGNSQDFFEIQLIVSPLFIPWVGRDIAGYSLLYRLFRSMPSLFGFKK